MPTDTLAIRATVGLDSPWRRLVWTLPSALFICAATLVWFAFSMHQPAKHADEPAPINAELVELPTPVQPHAPQKAPQKIVPTPPAAKNVPQPQIMQSQSVATEQPSLPVAPPSPPQAAPVAPAATPTSTPVAAGETRGAKAISQTMPDVPDELRQEYVAATIPVRFQIAEDGTFTATLIKPTQNPRLNRWLLEHINKWKFSAKMENGKPVPSEQTVTIKFNVR
jgi:protein TonB